MSRIDLLWIVTEDASTSTPEWPLGEVYQAVGSPEDIARVIQEHLRKSDAEAWLFWDSKLELPSAEVLQTLLAGPGEVWHCGHCLGLRGLPAVAGSIHPTAMLSTPVDPEIASSSWRLTFRAALVRRSVLEQLGIAPAGHQTLTAMALDTGMQWLNAGVILRHEPRLFARFVESLSERLPAIDEMRIALRGFGLKWACWAAFRQLVRGHADWLWALAQLLRQKQRPSGTPQRFFQREPRPVDTQSIANAKVTVLIPTVDRYPYLRVALRQLGEQTIPPFEIIVVDQTAQEYRDYSLAADFPDLPLRVYYLNKAGQCSSRNLGLQLSSGDYILFIDDDVELPPNFIWEHLRNLFAYGADVSSGTVTEPNFSDEPRAVHPLKISGVFPTNNTMARRSAFDGSGLFDLAYDRGQRADGDLGMRVYRSGKLMLLDPHIDILHHRAPQGGLRKHGMRKVTRSSSRNKISDKNLSSVFDLYLGLRYFTPAEVRELMWISVLGTFSARGSLKKRLLKVLFALVTLPQSIRILRERYRQATRMLEEFPKIGTFSDVPSQDYEVRCVDRVGAPRA